MSHVLYRLGRWAARHPWRVMAMWALAALTVVGASAAWGRELRDSFSVPGVDSSRATELLSNARSNEAGVTAQVVATPRDGTTFSADAAARSALTRLHDDLAHVERVVGVSDLTDPATLSPDATIARLAVQYPVLGAIDASDLHRLTAVVDRYASDPDLQVEAGGELFFHFADPGGNSAELVGLAAAVVILLIAFGSLVAMGMPIATALVGLAIGTASMGLVCLVIDIPTGAPEMAAMVGLGVGIDYALFLVSRHREFLAEGRPVDDAAGRALATSGQAVLFAGGTVVVAILGLGVSGVPMMAAAGVATSVVVAVMVLASLTLLPALLGLSGPWINRLTLHRRRGASRPTAMHERIGVRWAGHVSRHPWSYLAGGTLVMLALAAPVARLHLGFPDAGTLPESRTERRAYDLVAGGFGPGVNGPLLVAVDLSHAATSVDRADLLRHLQTAVTSDPGIAAVAPPSIDQAHGIATLVAIPTTKPQADATYRTVQRLRAEVFPAVLAGTGATAHVGGATATFGDVAARVTDRLAWFVAAVVGLSFLLLLVVFRSLLVPLKAALLNLLSIGASYGVMVMVFQWGWGKQLIGLETTLPIVSMIPMFMFAVLFGLSMDYEVFLLSRIREEYVATGDNHTAVAHGLSSSARVITSAALIMIAVFSAFIPGTDPLLKMLGLGLATAILIDATIVRLILVPATMTLLGHRNWWLPAWLDRRLPRFELEVEPA